MSLKPLPVIQTCLEDTRWLAATVSASRGQVLPEQGVVEMASAMEVQQRRNRCGLGEISLALSLGNSLECGVEACHVCLVVLFVVQLHDLAGDVWLEGAIVVCGRLYALEHGF